MRPVAVSQPLVFGKKEVSFSQITGRVSGSDKRAETHVYGSQYISSTTSVKQEFHIEDKDGSQEPIQLQGLDIPIQDGQTVAMVYSNSKIGTHAQRLAIRNTERYYRIPLPTGSQDFGLGKSRVRRFVVGIALILPVYIVAAVIGIVIATGLGVSNLYSTNDPAVSVALAVGFLSCPGYWIYESFRGKRVTTKVNQRLDKIALDALKTMVLLPPKPRVVENEAQSRPQVIIEKEVLKIPCKFCGTLVDPIRNTKCSSCGANLRT